MILRFFSSSKNLKGTFLSQQQHNMASELLGLGLSAAILIAASITSGSNDQNGDGPSIATARAAFDAELTSALNKEEGNAICLAAPFSSSAFETLQKQLAAVDIPSRLVTVGENGASALDIDLSSFLPANLRAVQGERQLFQALAKENVLLCPSEALSFSPSGEKAEAGHFFVTAPVSDSQVDIVVRRICRAVKKGDNQSDAKEAEKVEEKKREQTPEDAQAGKRRRVADE